MTHRLALAAAVMSLLLPASGAHAAQGSLRMYAQGGDTVTSLVSGPDGNVWGTTSAGKFRKLPPADPQNSYVDTTPTGLDSNGLGGAGNLFIGPGGAVWFSEGNSTEVGRINLNGASPPTFSVFKPTNPLLNQVAPDAPAITSLPDGTLWYQGDEDQSPNPNGDSNKHGMIRFNPNDLGSATFLETPTNFSYGITVGPDHNIWVTHGTVPSNSIAAYTDGIDRITPGSVLTTFSAGITPVADPGHSPLRGIVTGPDGALWFTEPDRIGRITTDGNVTEFTGGITSNADIRDIALGPDGALWFTEYQGHKIGRITTDGTVTEYGFPDFYGGQQPRQIIKGPDGLMWFNTGGYVGTIEPGPAVAAGGGDTSGGTTGGGGGTTGGGGSATTGGGGGSTGDGGSSTTPPPKDTKAPTITRAAASDKKTLTATAKGAFGVSGPVYSEAVTGSASAKTSGKVTPASKTKKVLSLGTVKFSAASGAIAKVTFKLSKANLKTLTKLKKLKLTVTFVAQDAAGNKVTKPLSVTLKAPKRK